MSLEGQTMVVSPAHPLFQVAQEVREERERKERERTAMAQLAPMMAAALATVVSETQDERSRTVAGEALRRYREAKL